MGTSAARSRHGASRPDDRSSLIERAAASRAAVWVAAGWGAAEASLFFLVPDVWVGFVALFAPRRTGRAWVAALAGALVGATALWRLAPSCPGIRTALASLPGIRPTDLADAADGLASEGYGAFLTGPLRGLPVKLHVHESAVRGEPLPLVLVFVALNRVERVGPSALGAAAIGVALRGPIARHRPAVLAAYVALTTAGYAVYFGRR